MGRNILGQPIWEVDAKNNPYCTIMILLSFVALALIPMAHGACQMKGADGCTDAQKTNCAYKVSGTAPPRSI